MEFVEMTDEEINLLCSVYSGEQMIRDGQLLSYQRTALEQLRVGKAYLAEKYPSYHMDILTYAPASTMKAVAEIRFKCEEKEEAEYKVKISVKEDKCVCKDNFFFELIGRSYDEKIEKNMRDAGVTVKAYTRFMDMVGLEVNEKSSIDDLLAAVPRISRLTDLFYDGTDNILEAREKVTDCIQKTKTYGSFTIYYVPEGFDRDVSELRAACGEWDRDVYNSFDID